MEIIGYCLMKNFHRLAIGLVEKGRDALPQDMVLLDLMLPDVKDYVTKPFLPVVLRETVHSIINSWK